MSYTYRTFQSPGGQVVNGVAYILDTTSGLFRPVHDKDLAPVIDSLNISGVNVNTDSLEGLMITGNLFLANISGTLNTLVPISGNVRSTIINTAPLPISGVTQANITNTIPLPISGVTQSYSTIVQSGSYVASAPSVSGLVGPEYGVALQINPNRLGWGITNCGTGLLRVNFGTTLPTTGAAHLFLKRCTAHMDGLGGSFTDLPAVWKGQVAVSGEMHWESPAYSIWEF